MRAFFGIALSEPARSLLADACDAFRDAAPSWRCEKWVPPANYHLTLAFLGEHPRERVEAIAAHAADGLRTRRPFTVALGTVVASPRGRSATMLWATLAAGEHESAEIAGIVTDAAENYGIEPPRRPFAAHVTLVRARRPRTAPDDALAQASEVLSQRASEGIVSVGEVILYSSTLTPRGPVYEAIGRLPLHGD
ncbi:RNA 2',3'-cyclic phosphodiesterase [Coriobacteriia bacterium Es71-Z0120]|uniref:RNA 2',3'-cyclic phosphodiesterase n=1 Tax=Parvivirga hydrogeniphila TaxID=2939460 RepID=UPI002260D582|nr:RNA 2',3'-cyclic phosphodiesterase [Parvivirga hydrogeniphila]MCL4079619.1 RNA 2',3'-cyclic phosphodiesterase [Parvivirga hydrogeniphila]